MKHGMKLGVSWTLLALAWAAVAQAGPLKPDEIAADVSWVAHVDADALRASPVMKDFCEECLKDWPAAKERLEEAREKWGVNLCNNLHDITLYGTKIAPDHHVMIVRADVNQQQLTQQLEKVVKPETIKCNGRTIYTWTKFKGTKFAKKVAMTFAKPDTLVFASSLDLLKQALDALENKAPSLGKDSPLTADIPAGTIFFVRAIGLENAEMMGKLPILSLLKQFDYAEGQHNGKWFGKLRVEAESEQVANRIKEVYQGHLAMLQLHFHDQPGVLKLLDKIQIGVDGQTARMTFEAPAEQVAEQMPAFCKAMKEHWKWHMMMCQKVMAMKYQAK